MKRVSTIGLLAEAAKQFGQFTPENQQAVKAWIRQQLAARGERAEAEAANVRPFAAIAELSGEDGWK
jgi:hypothetical protein